MYNFLKPCIADIFERRPTLNRNLSQLKPILESLYLRYNHRRCIPPDPLQFLYRFSTPADIEIAGLLSAVLAYGRVEQIQNDLNDLFSRIGPDPADFVKNFSRPQRKKLDSFKHRFTTGSDIADLLELLHSAILKNGSLESFFSVGYNPSDPDITPALTSFCRSLLEIYSATHSKPPGRGLKYLLASPADGSPCKRLNLFLRWMVRKDNIDLGLWKSVDKAKLIVPLDTHMTRLCKILRLYTRKTASIAAAKEITNSFTEICPSDPVKYDFALSRIGILENCTGKYSPACPSCQLISYCKN